MASVAWFVPRLLEGAGGHRNIVDHLRMLIDVGHECHIYVEDDGSSEKAVRAMYERSYGPGKETVYRGFAVHHDYDLGFGTMWYTAPYVLSLTNVRRAAYFVQDFECLFNPMGDGYLMAQDSYRLGIPTVTLGRWLTAKLTKEYGSRARYFEFTVEDTIYHPLPDTTRENAICFVFQPDKPRRCCLIGADVLRIVKSRCPDTTIYLYGSRAEAPGALDCEHLGLLSLPECNELYNRCRVGLCISSTNPSRIPFEMMAAGLPVVDLHMENNCYDMSADGGVLLAEPNAPAIAEAVVRIIEDQTLCAQMSRAGRAHMAERTTELARRRFLESVEQIFADRFVGDSDLPPRYAAEPVTVRGQSECSGT
jgi:WsaF, C-terminal domain